jgi:predicted hydrolase (HD superfamily)
MPTRESALALLEEWNQNPSLRKHGLLVEAGVRGYATDDGLDAETVERWGIAGLLHDLDYERFPDPATHGAIAADELERLDYPEEVAGFLVAVALMRPSKRLADVAPEHVRKRMRDKAFARAVPREMLLAGATEIGLDLDEHAARMVRYLGEVAPEVGL